MKEALLPERKHPRLKNYDYSQNGYYFVTLCTRNRAKLLSEIVGRGFPDAPHAAETDIGKYVSDAITFLNNKTSGIEIDKFIIMPNHVHMLVIIHEVENGGASGKPRPTNNVISKIISSLKRYTNRVCKTDLWQASFYDHIIRDETDYLKHWQYIDDNPKKWVEDEYYA